MNPYLHPVWSQCIRGAHHGGARTLQNLALHLYNSPEYPVNVGYLCAMSDDHWEAAHAMMLDYRANGENNRAFIAMCEDSIEERRSRTDASEALP